MANVRCGPDDEPEPTSRTDVGAAIAPEDAATLFPPALRALLHPSTASSTLPLARRGKVLGEFELVRELGHGGMSSVWLAVQRSLGRQVAVKLLAHRGSRSGLAERFQREARAAGQVSHPNVITVFGAGEDDGCLWMAMELVSGGDADRLAEQHGGKLAERRALEIVRDCARGLVAVERAGLVHRDIKPANLFVTEHGDAKLADLGLARSLAGEDRMTDTGLIVGTPCYMAPEQARSEAGIDTRADIYALGATLYRLVTGEPPFDGASPLAVITRVVRSPTPDARRLAPHLSRPCLELLERTLVKDPARRYQSAADLLAACERALGRGRSERDQGRGDAPRAVVRPRRPALDPALTITVPPRVAARPTPRSPMPRARSSSGRVGAVGGRGSGEAFAWSLVIAAALGVLSAPFLLAPAQCEPERALPMRAAREGRARPAR